MNKRVILGTFLATVTLSAAAIIPAVFDAAAADQTKFTAQGWTEQVGFKPDLSKGAIAAGKKIKGGEYNGMEKYIPDGLRVLIDKYKLELKIRDYKAIHPSKGYIKATNQYFGQPKIIETGNDVRKKGLEDYTGGLPFPQPVYHLIAQPLDVSDQSHAQHQGHDP